MDEELLKCEGMIKTPSVVGGTSRTVDIGDGGEWGGECRSWLTRVSEALLCQASNYVCASLSAHACLTLCGSNSSPGALPTYRSALLSGEQ